MDVVNLQGANDDDEELDEDDIIFGDDQGMTLQFRMSDQAAAVIIQREVRKYLGGIGFYEA